MNLLNFQKPSRYINREANVIRKKAPVSVALAFPDIYDVGMSHLGLKILYEIINALPYASAERVFSPWLDLGDAMKKEGVLLGSLESARPLRDFDIVGVSLQYELSYTAVLEMLSLGGIPLRTEARLNSKNMPLVIAGGPCTVNPAPMSPFIDAFLIGDAEDAIKDILDAFRLWKEEGTPDRLKLLQALSGIEGVYVPALGKDRIIKRRFIDSLDDAVFPIRPIVPFTGIVHDRVNIEISRGCTLGCRFCQAGMTYRPVRERSPDTVLRLAEESLKQTGHDAISFTSLSSGDYSCLQYLMSEFNKKYFDKNISISLPSLRVATVNREMLREIKAVRKTGFTMAPEAGTERLRAVINKDFSEDMYVRALEDLFTEGWRNLKLYFMTGLPTETENDITAIPEMVRQALGISKRLTGRHVTLSVGISSFIPKPHTPFQWFGQNSIDLLREKNSYLRKEFLRKGVKFKGHNEYMSLLEAVFARGDEGLSDLIEAAWSFGCRLDAWTEAFDFEKWQRAMEKTGIDAADLAMREFSQSTVLPWDNINTGVSREFLWREYRHALSGKVTVDCRKHCHVCGLDCKTETDKQKETAKDMAGATLSPLRGSTNAGKEKSVQEPSVKVRLAYSKTGMTRYLSHLELVTALVRAMRRADFPLKYSEGFHPSPRISFGPALRVGVAGLREYLDVEVLLPFEPEAYLGRLNDTLPEGIHAKGMRKLLQKEKSLDSFIIKYIYQIRTGKQPDIEQFMDRKEVLAERKQGMVNVREMVEGIVRVEDGIFHLTVCDKGEKKARLDEILPEIFSLPVEDLDITRIAMYGFDGDWIEPLEGDDG